MILDTGTLSWRLTFLDSGTEIFRLEGRSVYFDGKDRRDWGRTSHPVRHELYHSPTGSLILGPGLRPSDVGSTVDDSTPSVETSRKFIKNLLDPILGRVSSPEESRAVTPWCLFVRVKVEAPPSYVELPSTRVTTGDTKSLGSVGH